MLLDVEPDRVDELVGGGDGEAAAQRHQADPGGELVRLRLAIARAEEGSVEQGRGDDGIELQALELAGAGHAGGDEPDADGGHEVQEHGHRQRDEHDDEVLPLHAMDAGQEAPVDDVPADLEQDPGQRRVGNGLDIPAEAQHQRQQDRRAEDARDRRPAAGAQVDDRAQRGPRPGQPADEAGRHVADALPHELPVGVVAGARHGVGDEGGEQAVDGPQQGDDDRRLHGVEQDAAAEVGQPQVGQAGRHIADDGRVGQHQHAQQRPGDQGGQRRRQVLAQLPRPCQPHDERDRRDGDGAEVDVGDQVRPHADGVERAARRDRRAQERQRLQQDDDDADARHEAGDHGVRRVHRQPADAQDAEQNLDQAGHDGDREDLGEVVGVGGDDDGDRHRHGARGPRDLRFRPAEHGREEADRDRPVEPRHRSQSRGDAESQRHRQPHHGRRDAAEDVAAEGLEVVVHAARPPPNPGQSRACRRYGPGSFRRRVADRRPPLVGGGDGEREVVPLYSGVAGPRAAAAVQSGPATPPPAIRCRRQF